MFAGGALRTGLLGLLILLLLGRGHREDAVIMLGMLEIILCHDAIARRIRVARHLQIFLVNMGGGAANLDLRPARIEGPVGIALLRPAAAATSS